MLSPGFYQRLTDLENHVTKDQELLKEFEEALRYEMNPRVKAGYRRDIERQRESLTGYKQEYAELRQELAGTPIAQMQKVENQLQQMDSKLNILLNGQIAILNRYDASEQDIIAVIVWQLNQMELVLTQKLLDALENNQLSELEIQQMLAVLEEKIPSLPPNQAAAAEIIKNPELDAKHKLKVTLPIIPMLVEYEGELEIGSGFNIKSAWEQLVGKLRR